MNDKFRWLDYALLVIFLISFFSSVELAFGSSKFCLSPTSCDLVQTSEYAYLFGIKNSYYGIMIFALLSLIAGWHIFEPHHHKSKVMKVSAILGSLVAIYFVYLQVFVIKAFCTYCMVIDISLILGLILVLAHGMKQKGWKGS